MESEDNDADVEVFILVDILVIEAPETIRRDFQQLTIDLKIVKSFLLANVISFTNIVNNDFEIFREMHPEIKWQNDKTVKT